jgi:hypothetical protein
MRRFLILLVGSVLFLPTSIPAEAANIHFVEGTATAIVDSTGSLTVQAKIAGLGRGEHTWTISGSNMVLTAGCRNAAGRYPNGTQKLSGSILGYYVSSSGVTRNGNLSIYQVFPAPQTFLNSCPSGQNWVIRQVSGDVQITLQSPVTWNGTIQAVLK